MGFLKKFDKFQKILIFTTVFFVLVLIIDFCLKKYTNYEFILQMYLPVPLFLCCYALGGLAGFILVMYKQNKITRILAIFIACINIYLLGIMFMFSGRIVLSTTEVNGNTYYKQKESMLLSVCEYTYIKRNILFAELETGICTE